MPTLRQPSHDAETARHPGAGLTRPDLVVPGGTGLMVQGGGMRDVFAMGALAELHRRGLADAFDLALGNSAGAIAAAYFVAGQAGDVDAGFWAQLRADRIVEPRRFWRIVDVDRLVEEAMRRRFPLDVAALRAARTRLLVGLTDTEFRLPRYVVAQELSDSDLWAAFKATAAIPGLYNRPLHLAGRRYVDGGFVDGLPLLRLRVLGCARIVAVCTVPLRYSFVNDSLLRRTVIRSFAATHSRHVRAWIGSPNPLYDENLEALLLWAADPQSSGVLAIAPEQPLADFTSWDGLHETFELGVDAARCALERIDWL